MTTTTLMPEGRQRYFNNDGTPAAGGQLYTYAAGTTNPKTVYQDAAGVTAHPNPITLDAKGEAVIFWNGAYKVDLKQADGQQVTGYPVDNVKSDPAGLLALLGSGGGAAVGYGNDTVGGALDTLRLADYTALRAYNGPQKAVRITGYLAASKPAGIAGYYVRDEADLTSADDGGICIVDAQGRRWKRQFDGMIMAKWFGAGMGAADDAPLLQAAFSAAKAHALRKPTYGVTVFLHNAVYNNKSTVTIPVYVNVLGETEEGVLINCLFNSDAFQDDVTAGNASWLYFTRIEEISILKCNTDGTANTTGNAITYRHNASLCRFRRLRIYGGNYGIWGENLGYSMWNNLDGCFFDKQTTANLYVGQGSNATKINGCQFHGAPIGIDFAGASLGNTVSNSDFEGYTDCAIRTADAQVAVYGGYNEMYSVLLSAFKVTGAGIVTALGGYYKGPGAGYLATISGTGYVTVRDAQIADYSYTWPALPGAGYKPENLTLSGNIPTGSTTAWVRGYNDFTFNLAPGGYNPTTHNLGLPPTKIDYELYATPNAGYMNGKEVKVSGKSGLATMGYAVWFYDTNNIHTRMCSAGGLMYDTATSTYGNTGVSTAHALRLRVKVQ